MSVKHPGDPLAAKRNDEVDLGAAGIFSQILADRHPRLQHKHNTERGSTGTALTGDPHRRHPFAHLANCSPPRVLIGEDKTSGLGFQFPIENHHLTQNIMPRSRISRYDMTTVRSES